MKKSELKQLIKEVILNESTDVKSTTLSDLIKEGAKLNKTLVEITWYPAYDEKQHSNYPPKLIQSLKKEKKEIFDIIKEGTDIISLKKSKNVKSITWV